MISRFFIDRPIFAAVISTMITLAGLLAIKNLPIAQYPEITPPSVSISAAYPGASAETVASAVAAPLEQQINGVEGMTYMTSSSTNSGASQIIVTFDVGRDPDLAAIDVHAVLLRLRASFGLPRPRNRGIFPSMSPTTCVTSVSVKLSRRLCMRTRGSPRYSA